MLPKDLPERWKTELDSWLNKNANGRSARLSATDFTDHVRIDFPDGSIAEFRFAFSLSLGSEIAVFTEHCGYHIFPAIGAKLNQFKNDWAVYRLDYNSNEFVVEKGLSKAEADRLAEEYIAKGHHQHYWVDKQPAEDPDYRGMMSKMLESGSSQEMAIKVLLGQGASSDDCVDALDAASKLQIDECKAKVQEVVASLNGA